MDITYLRWPFFEPRHRTLAEAANDWASKNIDRLIGDHADADGPAGGKLMGKFHRRWS